VDETSERDAIPLRLRPAGRVIVLDPQDRVLLFRYDDGPPNGRHWCTPGGGLNAGEDYPAGARRELAEETGWTDVPLGPEVYERTLVMEYDDAIVRQHERFFLGRVEVAGRELGEVAAMHVSDGIAAARWWTLAELDATDEDIWPPELAGLIRELLAGLAYGRNVGAGWHGRGYDPKDDTVGVMTTPDFWSGQDRMLTVADMENTPDDEFRYELDDGILIVIPAPSRLHQLAVTRLTILLSAACPADLTVLLGSASTSASSSTECPTSQWCEIAPLRPSSRKPRPNW
jgi:ADP-ribose pyrophosphatase YjhB (NUDIX family)